MPHLNCPRCDLAIYKWGLPPKRFVCPRCLTRDGEKIALLPARRHLRPVEARWSGSSEELRGRRAARHREPGSPAA